MNIQKSISANFPGSAIAKILSLSLGLGLALVPTQISLAENVDEVFTVAP